MKTNLIKSLFLLVLVTLASCNSNDGDTTPPKINLIAPAEGAVLEIGNDHGVHFDMELADNEGLAGYKVEIHNNFNGHNHSRAAVETVPFHYDKSWKLDGEKSKKIHHHEIVIPADATPGKYHLMVFCTDLSGNESYVARNVLLSNDVEDVDHHHTHE